MDYKAFYDKIIEMTGKIKKISIFKNCFILENRKFTLVLTLFLIVFGIGVFFRSLHFGDWLIFQSDQSRDALIIQSAVKEGFDKIPLIGPQARGSALHLGPIFYYFQYFSGKIFGPSPESFAYPDLFFGIFTLPILFFLLRNFVSDWIALGVSCLASVSLFLVTFSRFAWNPNSLSFFTTLFALFFISAFKKNQQHTWFVAGYAICIGIIIQLHFVAALSLLIGLFIFLLFFHPLKWKDIFICILIITVFQTPTIAYEIKNKGMVSEAFIETVEEKGLQNEKHGIHEKLFRAYQSQAEIFWLVATGKQNTATILTRGFSLKCDKKCESGIPMTMSSLFLFSFLLWIGFQRWRKEKNAAYKQALTFFGIWFISFFFITTLVAYQISTRFYLGIIPLIFLVFAFLIGWVSQVVLNKFLKSFIFAVLSISIVLNFHATSTYLKDLSYAEKASEHTHKDLVFGTEKKVTLKQLRSMATETDHRFPANNPIFISGESRYARSLYYILSVEKGRNGCYQKGSVDYPVFQDHVIVTKNKEQNNIIPFGTLAIQLISQETNKKSSVFPEECLTY